MLHVDKRIELQQANDIQNILNSESGRRFLWRLIGYCGVYRDVEGEQVDIMKQLGRRQVGLYLLGILTDTDDEQVFTMMKEAKSKDMEDAHERKIEMDAIERDTTGDSGNASHDYRPGTSELF